MFIDIACCSFIMQRLTAEWKNGSVQDETRRESYKMLYYNYGNDDSSPCPLLKVHWLRLIVDEGHTMGKSSVNNSIQFASWISAQRRWSMTGTPTPQTASNSGLKNLFGLMKFLKHDYFCPTQGGGEVRSAHTLTDGVVT